MSILSRILHQRLKSRPWPSPDAIFVATSQTRGRAMRPSAARVRSRVKFKPSDWVNGDKIIVVLLYTCGREKFLQRQDIREFEADGLSNGVLNVKLNTSNDTEEHPSIIFRPIKYPVEIRHALSLPVSASTHIS